MSFDPHAWHRSRPWMCGKGSAGPQRAIRTAIGSTAWWLHRWHQ
jgi:hypothetical protein